MIARVRVFAVGTPTSLQVGGLQWQCLVDVRGSAWNHYLHLPSGARIEPGRAVSGTWLVKNSRGKYFNHGIGPMIFETLDAAKTCVVGWYWEQQSAGRS